MSEEKEPQTLHQLKQRQTRELKALKGAPLPKNKTHGSKGAKKDRKLALAAMDARHKEEIAEFQANGPKKSAVGDEGGEGEAVVDANPEVDEKASASQAVKADNDAAAAASKPSFSSTTATATATSPASSCCSASACAAQSAQELPKYASKKAKALAKKQRQVCMYVYMYACVRIHVCMYVRMYFVYVSHTYTHTTHGSHTHSMCVKRKKRRN
jgi:hypothetical protein